jgi:hypothetical protein
MQLCDAFELPLLFLCCSLSAGRPPSSARWGSMELCGSGCAASSRRSTARDAPQARGDRRLGMRRELEAIDDYVDAW